MKANIILLLLFPMLLLGQPKQYCWSNLHFIMNKSDSAFLGSTETKMWDAAKKQQVAVFSGFKWGCIYNQRMSQSMVDATFKDSSTTQMLTSRYEMSLLWDIDAETFHLLSFNPMLRFQRHEFGYYSPMVWDTAAWIRMPLLYYSYYLSKDEFSREQRIIFQSLAASMGGMLNHGDTITRMITFTVDSNELLPQAPIRLLLNAMKDGLFSGELYAYSVKDRSGSRMTKNAIEQAFVQWDSTNNVEDPNHHGTFILAPLKRECQVKSLILYERWVPMNLQVHSQWGSPPQPLKSFRREVISYGLKIDCGKVIWIDPFEMSYMLKDNFNLTPYEETFRAERYRQMKIVQY